METMIISVTDTDHLRIIGAIGQAEEGAIQTALSQWPHGTKAAAFRNHEVNSIDPGFRCYFVDFCGSPWGGLFFYFY